MSQVMALLCMIFFIMAFVGLISPKMVLSKWGIKIGRFKTFLLFIFLGIASMMILGNLSSKEYELRQAAIKKQELERQKIEKEKAEKEKIEKNKAIVDNFRANETQIIHAIELLIENKHYDLAESEIKKHDIKELQTSLIPIKNKLEEAKLLENNEKVSETDFDEKVKIYSKLIKINPSNEDYILNLNSYKLKQNEEKEKEDKRRIQELVQKVKKLPGSEVKENLEIYKELLNLEPDNAKYQEKVEFYEKKMKAINLENKIKKNSDLELLSWRWSESHGYVKAEGQIKNISGRKLDNVEALVTWFDSNDNMITSKSSLIEYKPLLAGQISPFKVMTSFNPAMSSAIIEFKFLFGGKIPTYKRK